MVHRVLLLNPPSDRLYIRDQFCSHVSKGSYYWQPLDLLVISGALHAAGYELAVIDAVAEGLDAGETLRRLVRFAPDAVVALTGSDSVAADFALLADAKRTGVRLAVAIGDVVRDRGEALLADHPAIDACLTDFVVHGLDAFLRGEIGSAHNMIVRTPDGIRHMEPRTRTRRFTTPVPRYELFPLERYRLPYTRFHPYATIITSNWCPYQCRFCPFAVTPYRAREVEDVLENLDAIRALGIRQVHVADWTFAVDRRQAIAIVQGMIDRAFGFTWSCLSRVDLMDVELMQLMRRAGCDLIEFGVESGNQAMLDRYLKGVTLDEIRRAFQSARDAGISTLATFVLGLPGETRQSLDDTLALALEIRPTYCSFNAASPRMATGLRHDLIADGTIADDLGETLDSSRAVPVFSTGELSAEDVHRFRRRAIRRFYLRPAYVADRARRVGSVVELENHIANGLSLAWQALRPESRAPTRLTAVPVRGDE